MIHLLIGPPASGKTTILNLVAEANNVVVLNAMAAESSSVWLPAFQALKFLTKPVLVIDEATFVSRFFTKILISMYSKMRDKGNDPQIWIASHKDIFPDYDARDGVLKYNLNPSTTQP